MELPIRRYGDLMFQYLYPLRRKVYLLAGLIFATLALQLVNPQIIRGFIDTAVSNTSSQPLIWAGVVFLVTSLLLQLVGVAATYVGEDVGWQSTNQLRADLARHCLHLDMSFHNEHTPGEMIERIDGDVANIAIFFAQFVIRIVGNVLLIFGVLIVLLWEDWRISLALGIFTAVSLIGLSKLRQVAVPAWKAAREANADLMGFIEEQLGGTEDIRASGAVPYVMRRLAIFSRARMHREIEGADKSIIIILSWIALFTIGQLISMLLGYSLYRSGTLTIGSVYLIFSYTAAIFQPLREISNQIENMQQAAAGIDRVEQLYRETSQVFAVLLPVRSVGVMGDGRTYANAIGLQRDLPTPDPELTAELQRMIDDMNVATHACLRFVLARNPNDAIVYQDYLARAVDHLDRAKLLLDADLRPS